MTEVVCDVKGAVALVADDIGLPCLFGRLDCFLGLLRKCSTGILGPAGHCRRIKHPAREAYRGMLARGFRADLVGVAMERPDEPGYNRADVYVMDDWR